MNFFIELPESELYVEVEISWDGDEAYVKQMWDESTGEPLEFDRLSPADQESVFYRMDIELANETGYSINPSEWSN